MPTTLATDDFNRADGALGSNWTGSVGQDFTISSNQAVGVATDDHSMYWSADTPDDDQYAQVTIENTPSSLPDFAGPIVRASATDWVVFYYDVSGGNISIEWYNGGSYTSIDTDTATVNDGDEMRLEAEGTTFRAYINDSEVLSGTNASAPSSGHGGMYMYNVSGGLDNFEVGNLADPGGDPEAGLIGGKLIDGGLLLKGLLVRT